ncbi:uracil-DNA glycosylase [Acidithiobacillus sp. IBUN Pt1247-S3]|uniref:uracil-DNA glycosylase n=1 Tax=Acidithiobacillus sp. IBUN Pt1247-S3 TaxID=3166642 RepID=UPI0034E5C173
MVSKIFSPAQIAYLQALEIAVPAGIETLEMREENPDDVSNVKAIPRPSPSVVAAEEIPELSAEEPLADESPIPVHSAEEKKSAQSVAPTTPITNERIERITRMDWSLLETSIHACRACSLGETRKNAVVGAGTRPSPWLFVGEAPGAEEDRRGEAFVGRGGQLLDAMLGAMGLSRNEQVYIANVLKCRPPQNRDPLGPEVRSCLPFLQRQIALLQPRIIVAMGRFAAQSLLQSTEPLANLRGALQHYGEIPLIVTYHPAYLLRNPIEKRKVWEDLKLALQTYADLPQGSDASASATE